MKDKVWMKELYILFIAENKSVSQNDSYTFR